jgi:hypothetical protein
MKRLEALADALAKMNGALDPQFDAYQLRNPGLLRAFSPKHARDEKGRRIFSSLVAGYENLLLDLRIKCSGQSRAKLTPESPLVDLITTYGNPVAATRYVVNFLRHALKDATLREDVKLGWFLEEEEKSHAGPDCATEQPAA